MRAEVAPDISGHRPNILGQHRLFSLREINRTTLTWCAARC
jgi:hypothetical protein